MTDNSAVLQPAMEKVTLAQALLSMSTFRNGCDFRLIVDSDEHGNPEYYLEWGCYGVHTNLAQGNKRLLMKWLESRSGLPALLEKIPKETICELLNRRPCKECGGFRFNISRKAEQP